MWKSCYQRKLLKVSHTVLTSCEIGHCGESRHPQIAETETDEKDERIHWWNRWTHWGQYVSIWTGVDIADSWPTVTLWNSPMVSLLCMCLCALTSKPLGHFRTSANRRNPQLTKWELSQLILVESRASFSVYVSFSFECVRVMEVQHTQTRKKKLRKNIECRHDMAAIAHTHSYTRVWNQTKTKKRRTSIEYRNIRNNNNAKAIQITIASHTMSCNCSGASNEIWNESGVWHVIPACE